MIYTPHILQLKQLTPVNIDELGRPISGTGEESWVDICGCRCDDNTDKEFKSENGIVYRPSYHIVCNRKVDINPGDYLRCMNGCEIRGEGKAYVVKRTNYFNYSEIWI